MARLIGEMVIAAGIAFGGVLGPLTTNGLTSAEWLAAAVAGLTAAGALLRQQPKK